MRLSIPGLSLIVLTGCGPAGIGVAIGTGTGGGGGSAPLDATVTAGPPPATREDTATFAFTSNKAAVFEGRYDAGDLGRIQSPLTLREVRRGTHEFVLTARAGDETRTVRWQWTMDPDPPVTTFADAPEPFWPADAARFELRAEQGSTFAVRVDGSGELQPLPGSSLALTGLAQGGHELEVQATDPAGNVESPTARWAWFVDTLAPQPPAALTPTPRKAHTLALVWPAAADSGAVASGIAGYRIHYGFDATFGGRDADQGPSPLEVDASQTGLALSGLQSCRTYFLRIESIDRAGNTSATARDVEQRTGCGGTGRFAEPRFFAVGDGPVDVLPVDIDADGRLDLAVLHAGSRDVAVLRNAGGGNFDLAAISAPLKSDGTAVVLVAGDITGNGVPDLIVGSHRTDNGFSTVSLLDAGGAGGVWDGTLRENGRSPFAGVARLRGLHLVDDAGTGILFCVGDGMGALLRSERFGFEESFAQVCFPATGQFADSVLLDLDGQGLPDIVATLPSGRVAALLARGFGQGRYNYCGSVFSVGGLPTAVAGGDFDGDGEADVAVGIPARRSVDVLRGLGGGILDLPTTYAFAGSPQGIAADDVDDDAILDLVVAQADGSIGLRLGTGGGGRGDGAFGALGVLPGGSSAWRLQAADLDGDGVRDLVFVDPAADRIGVLFGDGTVRRWDGTFLAGTPFAANVAPDELAIVDVDNDRIPDLVQLNRPAWTVTAQRGVGDDARGTGDLGRPLVSPIGIVNGVAGHTAVGDMNGDRIADLVVTYVDFDESKVRLLLGNGTDGRGDGTFRPQPPFFTGLMTDNPGVFGIADFNHDGRPDLVEATYRSRLWLQAADGSFTIGQSGALPVVVTGATTADFDDDGTPDTAMFGGSLAFVLLTPPGLTDEMQVAAQVALPAPVAAMVVRDLGADGVPDLALLGTPGLQIALGASAGRGDLSFGPVQTYPLVAPDAIAFAAADLDRDGDLDFVVSHAADPARGFSVVRNNGDGTFGAAQPIARRPEHAAGSLAIADMDHDGVLDLVVGDPDGAAVVVYRGGGVAR